MSSEPVPESGALAPDSSPSSGVVPVQVAVTGAAGQIGYALLFRLAAGEVFGPHQPVVLRLLEVEAAMPALDGVIMELEDCAFPSLVDVVASSDPKRAFDGASWALLIGSVPRRPGMERSDLLSVNAAIFKAQGKAIAATAADDVRVVVVGNPCNTNCLIARANAPEVPPERWFAMTRLDQNRARSLLAAKAGVAVSEVANVAIWGNHSATQYPDFQNATIGGRPASEVIADHAWLREGFISAVQQRGAAVLAARGTSSAASAASAVIDSIRSIREVTPPSDNAALAVVSRGEYGVPDDLQFGFPVRSDGTTWSVAEGFEMDDFARRRLRVTTDELLAERDGVRDLLP